MQHKLKPGGIVMNITVIGTGYVGLITGACMAEMGMDVLCMDNDEDKVAKLKDGIVPIYEPGLAELVRENYANSKRLNFTSNPEEAADHAELIFITVNTPTLGDDSSDLRYVFGAAKEIARYMKDYKVIITKSTVPVGTGKQVKEEIRSILCQRNVDIQFDVVSNPEFLREGAAVRDFFNTDRIVIGVESEKAANIMKKLYNIQILIGVPLIVTNIETAELIKYASNAFLATKISYINEIANICELCGADVSVVSRAMGLDGRIGSKFLNPGPGFGGSCFPKDSKALVGIGKRLGYVPRIVKSVISVNGSRYRHMVRKIRKIAGKLENRVITILGIAFKPETDDIRESPAVYIIKALSEEKAIIKVYDPAAMDNLKKHFPELTIQYCDDVYSACEGSDCVVLVTEWDQFKNLDFPRLKEILNTPVFIDLRNVYNPSEIKKSGFVYEGIGRNI